MSMKQMKMKLKGGSLVLLCVLLCICTSVYGSSQLRGIHPDFLKEYQSDIHKGTFRCRDGSAEIDAKAINDDYCDCKDGSDEPGTSACTNGRLFCRNKGYVSKYVSSMFVDDGVCDCCDGTDERTGCPNTCVEEGSVLRKALETKITDIKAGIRTKQKEVSKVKVETKAELEAQADRLEKRVKAQETLVEKINEHVRQYHMKKKLSMEKQANADVDVLKPEKPTAVPVTAKEEAEEKAETEEDIGRKIAARWTRDPNAAKVEDPAQNSESDSKVETDGEAENTKPEIKKPADWDDEQDGEWVPPKVEDDDEDDDEDYEEEDEPEDFDYEKLEKDAENTIEDTNEGTGFLSIFKRGINIIKEFISGSEGAKLEAEAHTQSERLVQMKKELEEIQKKATLDFGEDNQYSPLYGECFSKRVDGYEYKICPFVDAKQNAMNLGKYKGFNENQSAFLFTEGTQCWNGPKRSMMASLVCGAKTELTDVKEPNVCEYTSTLVTPLACEQKDLDGAIAAYNILMGIDTHDEL